MIYIDLPADLNLEDDQGRNVTRLADGVTPEAVTPGAVLVAGAARARAIADQRQARSRSTRGEGG